MELFSEKIKEYNLFNTSGSTSSERFAYQVACVFLTFLTLYKKTNDFLILLDYIDDFVVVENYKKENELISFVQVKTQKDKPISIRTIIRKERILKQADNYRKFLDQNVKNVFMSNLGVSFKNQIVANTELISLKDCKEYDGYNELVMQICDKDIGDLSDFYLLKASISLNSFKEDLKGKMMSYVQDNEMSELTIESIETIYLKIWNDLTEKQIYSPTPDDKNNIEVLINKKGIMYSHIKDIFSIMTDVQLPEKGKISEFCRSNKMFYDTTSYSDFIKLFKEFRIESAKRGFDVIHESIECLKENNDTLSILMDDTYIFSKKVLEILDNDKTICSSEFYKKFRVCLAIYNTYRAFNF